MIVAVVNGKRLVEGDKVTTFRGEEVTFKYAHQGGRNRVYCTNSNGASCEWFPSVVNAELEER